MLDQIIDILKKNSAISDWSLEAKEQDSLELFYIQDKLDMNRRSRIFNITLQIFVNFSQDGKDYTGNAEVHLSPNYSLEECEAKITAAVLSARLVKNAYYPLPQDKESNFSYRPVDLISQFKDAYPEFLKAVFEQNVAGAKLNSLEVFVNNAKVHYLNSRGLDLSFPASSLMLEPCTDCNSGQEPVEIFNDYNLVDLDLEKIREIILRQLQATSERSQAETAKAQDSLRLILTGSAVEDLLDIYLRQVSDRMVYQGQSRAKLGEAFLLPSAAESVNLSVNPQIKSIYARPVDHFGKVLQPYPLLEQGVVKNYLSSARFSHYLGLEHQGYSNCFTCAPGSHSLESYKEEDYLEMVTFSSFIADPLTGNFGGEFRLARQKQHGQLKYLTAGAISENLFDCQERMRFSSELEDYSHSRAPKAIIIDDVAIS